MKAGQRDKSVVAQFVGWKQLALPGGPRQTATSPAASAMALSHWIHGPQLLEIGTEDEVNVYGTVIGIGSTPTRQHSPAERARSTRAVTFRDADGPVSVEMNTGSGQMTAMLVPSVLQVAAVPADGKLFGRDG